MKTMILSAIVASLTTLGAFAAPTPAGAGCCGGTPCCDACPTCCESCGGDCCGAACAGCCK